MATIDKMDQMMRSFGPLKTMTGLMHSLPRLCRHCAAATYLQPLCVQPLCVNRRIILILNPNIRDGGYLEESIEVPRCF
jgi:hypothetical protein